MAIYAAPTHPLAQRERIRPEELNAVRELRLSTYLERDQARMHGVIWSAPNYLLLLSMAVQGLGWSVLPCALVDEFCHRNELVPLSVPGWPKSTSVDVVWSKAPHRGQQELDQRLFVGDASVDITRIYYSWAALRSAMALLSLARYSGTSILGNITSMSVNALGTLTSLSTFSKAGTLSAL